MSVSIIDNNNIPNYRRLLKELASQKVEVGIFGDDSEMYPDGNASVLLIATINEFGMNITVTPKMRAYLHSQGLHLKASTTEIKIPERSFIRSGFDERQAKIADTAIKLLRQVLLLQLPVQTFFETIGDYIVGQLKEYVTQVSSPPNHPFTVAAKGSSQPLIDTGRMRDAITHRVVKG